LFTEVHTVILVASGKEAKSRQRKSLPQKRGGLRLKDSNFYRILSKYLH